MLKKNHLFFLFLFFFGIARSQSYHFENLTVEDGLSQNDVLTVLQDKRGVLWFATKGGGVTIFDGVSYRYLKEENGLSSNIVYSLFEDAKGNIWIGTYDGLVIYDGKDLRTYNSDNGLNSNVVKSICEDANGKIWLATENGGISVLENLNSKELHFKSFEPNGVYIGNSFNKIIETSDGKIWIGGVKGMITVDKNRTVLYTKNEGLIGNVVFDIHEDINGNIWIATDEGVCLFDGKVFTPFSAIYPFNIAKATCIEEDKAGNLWIGTLGQGVVSLNLSTNEIVVFNAKNGLSEDIVLSIMEDASNNIWIGTQGGGINKFSGTAFTYFGLKDGMLSEKTNGLFYDSKGNLWIATREGIVKFDGKTYILINESKGLQSKYCNTVFEDNTGIIWVGLPNGLAKIKNNTVVAQYNYKDGIMGSVTSILQDSKNNLWFGTDGGGIVKYDGKEFVSFSMINGMSSNRVTSLLEDDENTLWIGTFGGGVNRYNGFEFLVINKEEGLSSNIVYCLEKGPRGDIYMGTEAGITRYDKGEILVINKKYGLSSDNIKIMKFDEENSLWVSSERGLDRIYFNPPQVYRQKGEAISEIKHYGKEEGIKRGEISSVCEDQDGNLWFGTARGLIKYSIDLEDGNSQKPITYITDLKIDYKHVDWRKKGYDVVPWTNLPKNLVLPYDTSHVTFVFVGVNHKAPYKVRYQWKLEGFDKEYTPLTSQNTVTYPKLPPGDYILKVIACNGDEDCNDQKPAIFEFSVSPPFWQEIWFITLIVIVLILLIYLMIKMREQKSLREREILELKVKERTQEVVDKNQQLELVNLEIVSKTKEIEEKNNDLNSSIRYALTIQQASLPPIVELKNEFNNSFIYHLPRDIVSGDFYWYKKLKNEFVIAIADCTGHGVPGAIMSMIGMTLLNEIIKYADEIEPGTALNSLDLGVRKAFENSETESNDGMDIILCTINTQTKTLKYSGAYRPLYIIRNKEIIEFKATKYAIGSKEVKDKAYETIVIPYQDNDCIYLFSDGYPDQFGGPDGKKFKTKVLKDMLLEICEHDMEKQKDLINNRYLSWKGKLEQVDDILFCGIKL